MPIKEAINHEWFKKDKEKSPVKGGHPLFK